jgi:hypothetical protein
MNKLNILSLNPESIKIYYRIRYLIKLKLAKIGTKFDIKDCMCGEVQAGFKKLLKVGLTRAIKNVKHF